MTIRIGMGGFEEFRFRWGGRLRTRGEGDDTGCVTRHATALARISATIATAQAVGT
jgi:hypothetical protein